MSALHWGSREESGGGSSVDTSTALPVSSSSRWAISGSENFADSTSPCSVIFIRPATVPGGWAWMARLAGPPPRPRAPPRPWKNTQRTPNRSSSSASATCAR